MKKIFSLIIASNLILAASISFAANKTDINTNWVCTTNASSPSTDADKAQDDQMAKTASSAVKAYSMAVQNCRDCTKITCEVKN